MRSPWTGRGPWPRDVVLPTRLDPAGLRGPTPGSARGPGWTSPARGWHLPAGTPTSPEQRILNASVLAPDGVVTGWAALRLAGCTWFDGVCAATGALLPVVLVVGTGGRPVPGVRKVRERLSASEVVVRHGVRCRTPVRALVDAMRDALDLRSAVVAVDCALAAGLVSLPEVEAALEGRAAAGWRGIAQARRACSLAVVGAESPPETLLRLVWVLDAGLPTPLCNWDLFDLAGQFLGRADLLDPVAGVVGEYDGGHHLTTSARARDIGREELFRGVGLEYLAVVAGQLNRRRGLVARLHAVRGRARWLPEEGRAWYARPSAVHRAHERAIWDVRVAIRPEDDANVANW